MEPTCVIQRVPLTCTPISLPELLPFPSISSACIFKSATPSHSLGDQACNHDVQFWAHHKEFLPNLTLMSMWSDFNHSTEVVLWELDKDEYKTQNQGM